jgi:Rha family phage regulatory protein
VKNKPDPATTPIVHKRRFGPVIAWTTDINAFLGRNRHDNVLQACYKVRAAFQDTDPDFFAANFIEGDYAARNGQRYLCYGVTRAGFVAMMKHIHNSAAQTALYLAAYDRKAEEARRREDPPDLDPAIIPDDHNIALDLRTEPGGPVEHARRIIEVSGSAETPELMAKILHALPPAPEEPELPPLTDPVVHADGLRVYATTLDIAAFFRKQHKNVLANVREIELLQPEFYRLNFQPVSYKGRNGEERPAFEVTKAGFALAVGGFTGAKALEFRVRYIQRFEEMEAALKIPTHPPLPSDYPSALRALAASEEAKQLAEGQARALSNQNAELVAKVEAQEEWVATYRRLVNADGLILPSDLAKVMHIPQPEFFDRLYKADYIFQREMPGNRKGRWLAKAQWVKKGLFDHKIYQQRLEDGTDKERPQLYVTSKGVEIIAMLFGKDDSGQGRLALGMH